MKGNLTLRPRQVGVYTIWMAFCWVMNFASQPTHDLYSLVLGLIIALAMGAVGLVGILIIESAM